MGRKEARGGLFCCDMGLLLSSPPHCLCRYVQMDEEDAAKELDVDMERDVVTCEMPFGSVLFLNNIIPHRCQTLLAQSCACAVSSVSAEQNLGGRIRQMSGLRSLRHGRAELLGGGIILSKRSSQSGVGSRSCAIPLRTKHSPIALTPVQVAGQHERADQVVPGPALAAPGPAQRLLRPQGLHHHG